MRAPGWIDIKWNVYYESKINLEINLDGLYIIIEFESMPKLRMWEDAVMGNEQKNLGLRIKSVRVLTGLNQEEFAIRCGFNHTSLRNWEFGRVYPRAEAIGKLVESFKSFGVFTRVEWLVNGSGEGPMLKCNEPLMRNESSDKPIIVAYRKIIEQSGGRAIITTIKDEDMKPYYNIGDVAGGIATNVHDVAQWPAPRMRSFLSHPVLIKTAEEDFQPRWLNFDGHKWWSRSQIDFSLKALCSDIIGTITLRLQSTDERADGISTE